MLLSCGLISKVEEEEPVRLTYVMTTGTVAPAPPGTSGVVVVPSAIGAGDDETKAGGGVDGGGGGGDAAEDPPNPDPDAVAAAGKRRRAAADAKRSAAAAADRRRPPDPSSSSSSPFSSSSAAAARDPKKPTAPIPSCLSVDVDVAVPGLYHDRTRELLRRVKRREFEYTSSRTKALKSMLSGGTPSCPPDENEARRLVEECVSGKGLTTKRHVPVLVALSNAAPAGSEARNAAIVDARVAMLLERLEHHGRRARACWEIVEACRGGGEVGGGGGVGR